MKRAPDRGAAEGSGVISGTARPDPSKATRQNSQRKSWLDRLRAEAVAFNSGRLVSANDRNEFRVTDARKPASKSKLAAVELRRRR